VPPPDEPPPADLTMTAVLSHPRRSYVALGAVLGGMPVWQRVTSTVDAVGNLVAGAVDVDHPLVIAITASQNVAAAIDVTPGGSEKLAQSFHLVPSAEGGFRARRPADPPGDASESPPPFACTITPPVSGVARLLCANDAATLRSVGPTLARMKPDKDGPDYHVEMGASSIRSALLEGSKKSHHDDSRSKGEAFGEKLVEDFASDLDRMAFDLSLTGSVDARFGLHFRGETSPFTHAATAEHNGLPGPAFWHLPVDTSIALFGQGADRADLEAVRTLVFGALDDGMKSDTCSEEVAYVSERLHGLFLTGGPFVLGMGNDVPGAEKAVLAFRALSKDTEAARAHTRQALESWTLIEVDEPLSKWAVPLRELALADARFAKCTAPVPAEGAKKQTEHTKTDDVAVAAGSHLPKGTLHLQASTTPTKDAPKNGPPSHTTHIFVVPDGEHTWFAIGENEAVVTNRVRAALLGAPPSGTLSGRAGLESLRAPSAGGGFLTVEGLMLVAIDDDTPEQLRDANKALTALRALPGKGRVPMPVSWRAAPGSLEAHFVLPLAAVPEILSMVNR
jgi:hypothetical protein